MKPTGDKIRLVVEELPELETEVALSGSCKQQEVGGGICLGIAAGLAVYLSYGRGPRGPVPGRRERTVRSVERADVRLEAAGAA